MDLREAEHIKKRWQEYTEELSKRDLHDPDNHDGDSKQEKEYVKAVYCHPPYLTSTESTS